MKKSFTSIILAFLLIAALSIPAMAADNGAKALELIPIDEANTGIRVEATDELLTDADMPSEDSEENDSDIQSRATEIRTLVCIREVHIRPIVACVETGEAYILENIERKATWSGYSGSSESLKLTASAISAFAAETFNALKADAGTSQYTWGIIGWNVIVKHFMQSQYPLSVNWTPTATCMDGTEQRSKNIPAQAWNMSISENFAFPEDYNDYYYIGVSGSYRYRIPSTGQTTGTLYGGAVMMNY